MVSGVESNYSTGYGVGETTTQKRSMTLNKLRKARSEAFIIARADLKSTLKEYGLTQEAMAAKLGITGPTLSATLRNDNFAKWEEMVRVEPRLAIVIAGLFQEIARAYFDVVPQAAAQAIRDSGPGPIGPRTIEHFEHLRDQITHILDRAQASQQAGQ